MIVIDVNSSVEGEKKKNPQRLLFGLTVRFGLGFIHQWTNVLKNRTLCFIIDWKPLQHDFIETFSIVTSY